MKLLSIGNTKTLKGETKGYRTYILHLAPANVSGYNVCPKASKGCSLACLYSAGRGKFAKTQAARIRKTKMFFEDRANFLALLEKDIYAAMRDAARNNLTPVFRLNGTSDIRWENYGIIDKFPALTFYDYTKIANRKDIPANYHLTFSRAESNDDDVNAVLATDTNVAVVFDTLPETWNSRPVINGDENDLRFLDPAGVIVGLSAKGDAKKDTSGFVILTGRK